MCLQPRAESANACRITCSHVAKKPQIRYDPTTHVPTPRLNGNLKTGDKQRGNASIGARCMGSHTGREQPNCQAHSSTSSLHKYEKEDDIGQNAYTYKSVSLGVRASELQSVPN
jgi:hypothetical protein